MENGVEFDYTYNNLNQQIGKTTITPDNTTGSTTSEVTTNTYDKRGNLIQSTEGSNTIQSYVYDTTNRMVTATNSSGNTSQYVYNGTGHLVKTIRNSVSKAFVIDCTGNLNPVLMENEVGGLTYRHTYGSTKYSKSYSSEGAVKAPVTNADKAEPITSDNSELNKVSKLADNYTLTDETYQEHIVDNHSVLGKNTKNRSIFSPNFDIKYGINSALKNPDIIKPNTPSMAGKSRLGYIFEKEFPYEIGVKSNGKEVTSIKVVINETGKVVTAYPYK